MATQLGLYKGSLALCKQVPVASLSDGSPAGNALDAVYAGVVQFMLEQAQWTFAKRANSIAGVLAAAMGYAYTFIKPSDFVRLISISASASYYPPLEYFEENGASFFAADSTIYVTYVSNGASYGTSLTAWPETFAKAVEAYLALQVYPQIASATKEDIDRVRGVYEQRLAESRAKDAINQTLRVSSTSRESVYQGAMRLCGFRRLNRFSDDVVAGRLRAQMPADEKGRSAGVVNAEMADELAVRRILDESYDNAVAYIIQEGLWNFGQRSVAIDASTDVEPSFGFSNAFEIPDDFVRLVQISNNDQFYPALERYIEEGGYWNANVNPLYVIYVSNSNDRGTSMNIWPRTVKMALEAYLSLEIGPYLVSRGLLSATRLAQLQMGFKSTLRDARSKDAMNQASGRMAPGRLAASRSRSRFGPRGGGPDRQW